MSDTAADEPGSVQEEARRPHGDNALTMVPWQGLLIGLAAGGIAWAVLEAIMPFFLMPEHLRNVTGNVAPEVMDEYHRVLPVVTAKNATLALVVIAVVLAALLAVAEQLLRRSIFRAVWGGLLAGLVATAVAIAAGYAGGALMSFLALPDHRLIKTMLVQSGMFGILGLGVGLGISLPSFRPQLVATCVIGCMLGGLLAAFLFPITAAVALPRVNTEFLVPEPGVGRLLWVLLAAALISLAVTGLGKRKRPATKGLSENA